MKVANPFVGLVSRRNILKGGVGLGAAGLGIASGIAAPNVWAAGNGAKVTIVNTAGVLSLVVSVMFSELKLLEKHGVDANIINVSDGNKILAGLIGGDGDICGGSGVNGLFPAIEKGAKIKMLSGSSLTPLAILYSNKPNVRSVKDLPGLTVGTGALGANLHQLVVAVCKKYAVDYQKINFANVGSAADILKALRAGAIDAGVGPIEIRDTAENYKLYPLVDGEFYKELPLYTNQATYATDKAIAEKREALVGVLAAYAELFRWMGKQENKEEFLSYYKKAINTATVEEAAFYQRFLSQPGAVATDLLLTEDRMRFVQELNVEFGAQKTILPFAQVADMSLAQEALKRLKS